MFGCPIGQNFDRKIGMINKLVVAMKKFNSTVKEWGGLHQLFDDIRKADTNILESISCFGDKNT
ncbi:hypothetical protein [Bacillus sp. J14TS2]|uniref:hypothetical protein n=1 Tax=Bacillus sp. J14TS2 TaxID=2807188 RepID=UPI001BB391B9|nr:hypothetical protein [Bacillus sp. J14TS2]